MGNLKAFVAVAGLVLAGLPVEAAEVKLLSSTVVTPAMSQIIPQFEKATGHKVVVDYQLTAAAKKLIDTGAATPDVTVIYVAAVDDLIKSGKIVAASKRIIAKAGVGVAVRAGAPKPDIGSTEAFKRTLLAAKSVSYTDPATGGASGVYMAKLLQQWGIAEQVNAKAKLGDGGPVGEIVARGDAEIGIQQVPELMAVKGVDLVGPLPADLQNYSITAAAKLAAAKEPAAADAFITFLSMPAAVAALKQSGMIVE